MDDEWGLARPRRAGSILLMAASIAAVQGCASITEGVTRGLTTKDGKTQPRPSD